MMEIYYQNSAGDWVSGDGELLFYGDNSGRMMYSFDFAIKYPGEKHELYRRLAGDLRALLTKKVDEDMPKLTDRKGQPVHVGDQIRVFNVSGGMHLNGKVFQLVDIDLDSPYGPFGFQPDPDEDSIYYAGEIELAVLDHHGNPVSVGDRVFVHQVTGFSELNGTIQELTTITSDSRHGRFGFHYPSLDSELTLYTDKVLLAEQSETNKNPETGAEEQEQKVPETLAMDKFEFAHQILAYLQDDRARSVALADPDGDRFSIRKILFNPDNGMIYLVREWDDEDEYDFVNGDTDFIRDKA